MSREEGDARKRGQVAALGRLGACRVKLLRQSCVQAVRGAWMGAACRIRHLDRVEGPGAEASEVPEHTVFTYLLGVMDLMSVPKGGLKNLSVFGWFWTTACC